VPEVEVGAVLGEDGRKGADVLVQRGLGVGVVVPKGGAAVVEGYDGSGRKMMRVGHAMSEAMVEHH